MVNSVSDPTLTIAGVGTPLTLVTGPLPAGEVAEYQFTFDGNTGTFIIFQDGSLNLDTGTIENVPAPKVAIEYWRLPLDATLREVVIAVRNDEAGHRDANHNFANNLRNKSNLSIGFGNLKQRIKKRLKRKF